MGPFILAIDAGGTAVKAAVYDLDGVECSAVGEALRPVSPAPGFIERDPDDLWRVVCHSVRTAVERAGIGPADIAAIGLTGTGNGVFLLDREGAPVRNGVLSSDQRAASVVEHWRNQGLEPGHIGLTGQHLWAGKPLPLLAWLDRHEPATVARAAHVLMCKDALRYRLTGRFAQEVTDASTASMIDQRGRRQTDAVLDHLGLSHWAPLLSETIETLSIAGGLTAEAAAALGLAAGTPVSAGSADGHAMLLALGVVDETLLTVIAGTWGLNQLATRTSTMDGSILCCSLGPRPGDFVLIDGGPTSASNFEWLVDRVVAPARGSAERDTVYAWCNAAVEALPEGGPPLFFLPFLNGGVDAPDARGSFIGLSSWHQVPHLVRAVYEGVAFEHRSHIDRLLKGRPVPKAARFAGGAARSRPWLESFAAVLDLPIEIGAAGELGALGSAILASVAAGLHPSLEAAVGAMTAVHERIEPDPRRVVALEARYRQYLALKAALAPLWVGLRE